MAHLSEDSRRLNIREITIHDEEGLLASTRGFADVCVVRLPSHEPGLHVEGIKELMSQVALNLGVGATLVTIGEVNDLVLAHSGISDFMRYQLWIAIKRTAPQLSDGKRSLPGHHFGALVHTKYESSLRHTKTRIEYTYCPACDKTTKDYGGKKHTYHQFGTLMSDVWRDINCEGMDDINPVVERFADLFGIEQYDELLVIDCGRLDITQLSIKKPPSAASNNKINYTPENQVDRLVIGDCLEELQKLPDNSIDFAFADPPYNLGKKYTGYGDDLEVKEYFEWCDEWIDELARVLRPGRTCALLNIPLWAIRHFVHMEKVLRFQNWIVWDALSLPVRMIMPAHYSILCFSKGVPRELPGLNSHARQPNGLGASLEDATLRPLSEGYCLRPQCITKRNLKHVNDTGELTDLWWDIHRLKHNSRRVDHPCLLPPQLMYRLISIFTNPEDVVLDCFNGAGTTTLAAHQLGRRYIGIEKSPEYVKIAQSRHKEIPEGVDPFRKMEGSPIAKNSRVRRMQKQRYAIPKKVLQLEVKRIADVLGRLPAREEVVQHSKYPIEYYDQYFVSWGEVCAAARTTGMSETRQQNGHFSDVKQLRLLERQTIYSTEHIANSREPEG